MTVLEVARVKTEWNFTFYDGLKSPYYSLWGQNSFLSDLTAQGYAKQSGPNFSLSLVCK